MERHVCDGLRLCRDIMSSDEDQPVVMDLTVGFNSRGLLVVAADLYDYENPARDCSTAAVVDREDAEGLARRYGVAYDSLPDFIAENMDDWREMVNPGVEDVRDCFKDITDRLLEEGCHFHIIDGFSGQKSCK